MALILRAAVMLVVLVGLPSAWVYYGPLPEGAQKFVGRMVEICKEALSGEKNKHPRNSGITAPRYENAAESLQSDPHFTTASFQTIAEEPLQNDTLHDQLEPHLSVLRKMGASQYSLEDWGKDEQLIRFCCAISLGKNQELTRQFEAVAEDSLAAVRQVVGEVSSWQNARGESTVWR